VSEPIERRAHAKINLCLSVASPEPAGSPRAGWHRIASWFHAIDLHDTVTLRRLPEGAASELHVDWASDAPRPSPIDWPPEKDLALRALRLLEAHRGRALPTRIHVRKRIPAGGGLGGGSSDAAAVLLGADALHGLALPLADLAALGTRLGSDVPFFIDEQNPPRPALVTGFGDGVERVGRIVGELDLCVPAFGCATHAVYAALDRAGRIAPADAARVRSAIESARRGGLASADLFNDLAGPAGAVEPRLAALVDALRCSGWERPRVTGSGSCVFRTATGPMIPASARADDGGGTILRVRLV